MTEKTKMLLGNSIFQWASMMLTLLVLSGGIFKYATDVEKRVSIVEKDNAEQKLALSTLTNTVNSGMGKRLELQRDYENMKENFKIWREENSKDHQEIKQYLNKLLDERRELAKIHEEYEGL